ncbi:MAG: DEAD/DEAH box helicase, partial [Candidatus Woesearchaeota archaeon]|nr:DEAD/DEAH box helicase [Candidatus Woesearchaeota archaeon]
YIVPLIALANDKFKDFKRKYEHIFRVTQSSGDLDTNDGYLSDYDLIICTAEKLDSLTRHHAPWLSRIGCIILDEIHLLNDTARGPTLEILITLLRQLVPHAQIIGLSATIGNPEELATWLDAELVQDTWRPVPLHKGVYCEGTITFDTEQTTAQTDLEHSNQPKQTKP